MLTTQSQLFSTLLIIVLASSFLIGTQVQTVEDDRELSFAQDTIETMAVPNEPLPDFSLIYNSQEKKQTFFSYLLPIVNSVNSRVEQERSRVIELQNKPLLNSGEERYLEKLTKKYRVKVTQGYSPLVFQELLFKVDTIPPSLVLAQAANESAWGTSRFATQGNNLFGQWCFSKGCGLIPAHRKENATHEVAKFDTVYKSVESYVLNLNRHVQYKGLRKIRYKSRQEKQPVKGVQLAKGLKGYSERGQEYVNEIQSMIRFNNLSSFDHSG